MPELPEVETTRSGIEAHILHQRIERLEIRQPRLRWPVPMHIAQDLPGQIVRSVHRRAKYLLVNLDRGTLILHLGMSGSLRFLPTPTPPGKHDHLDIFFRNRGALRFNDPRRFGAVLWTDADPHLHALISPLGPEPLGMDFSGDWLFSKSRRRTQAVKNFIMNGRVVVGVGNIYASEALFRAKIDPRRAAGRISAKRYDRLAAAIKGVLIEAIEQGGTSLRDFTNSEGKPGYFGQRLEVYGQAGAPCPACGAPLQQKTLGQRSSFFCAHCQK